MVDSFFVYIKRSLGIVVIFLVFIFNIGTVSAFKYIYEAFVSIDPSKVELIGGYDGGQFGAFINSGDLNGDGIEDLIVSSPFASTDSLTWNGVVSVIFGKSSLENRYIDLSLETPDLFFAGYNSGDQFGTSLSIGDYNNDEILDFAVGAYNAKNSFERPGKVYIYYGKRIFDKQNSYGFNNKPDIELVGFESGSRFGLSLYTLDVNNDGIDDLLVGAPAASAKKIKNSGVVYTYFGSKKSFYHTPDLVFYGQNEGEKFGSSITGGDFNGDTKTDVAIGAYVADVGINFLQAGKVYLYNGSNKFNTPVKSPSSFIEGDSNGAWFGFSLSSGDLNNDARDDVVVGSFPYFEDKNNGKISVFDGSKIFDSPEKISIEGASGEVLLGGSILVDDVNSDSKADIVVGGPGVGNPVSTVSGDVYMFSSDNYFGDKNVYDINKNDFVSVIHGENPDDWFGYSLKSLDFNGDGIKDLAIGSRYSDSLDAVNTGKVFILLGNNLPFGNEKTIYENTDYVSRGLFIKTVIENFDLKNKKADTIKKCYDYKDFCLFNFMAMSTYDDIQLEPDVLLYPDVPTSNEYYEYVTVGTMLGLINGFIGESNSPFNPDLYISRVQALKVILSAAELVPSMYRFELINTLGSLEKLTSQFSYFSDVNANIPYMWWYIRYINFAVENNIVDKGDFFRPDENITMEELNDMISRTNEKIKS